MGIKGLHGLLKSIQKPCHLKKFSGQTLGVDAYGWLHRGTIACAVDLVLDRPTTKHIDFVLNRVRMLLHFGVTPYLVFDGDDLPSKSGTETDRHKKRQDSKALGLELQRKGRTAEAYQELQKAVDVTPLMARQLIEELKKMKVQYVVAPYEADAQLVYLERQGIINGIISEDSDLLVFGAKRLLSKLDQYGDCIEINRADFTACREVSLIGWTDADFRHMCILSGCDYLPNIARMGLKTAYRSIRKYKSVERALRMFQFEGQYQVPADYLQNFKQAELTFLYQRVFCPKARKLVTLTPLGDDVKLEELTFIGDDVEPATAVGVAHGDLDPTTKKPLVVKPLAVRQLANGLSRRQTLGSSAELKPKKSINSFFTPKRVPLAELDPNSLTPSPSQQRLLERHANNSWASNPVTPRSDNVRSASSLMRQSSSPLVRSVERNSFLAHASRASNLQPVKRQRLCSEADEASLSNLPDCRSRFFASGQQETSPSGFKASRSKKARKSNLDVFSDDIAEDIMTQLPDPARAPNEPKEDVKDAGHPIKDVREEFKSVPGPGDSPEGTETTIKKDGNVRHKATSSTTVHSPDKSVSVELNAEMFHQVLDYHVTRQNSSLLSRYHFQPNAGAKTTTSNGSSPQDTRRPVPGRTASVRNGNGGTSPRRQRLTPLQRLGQTALARSQSMNTISPSVTRPTPRTLGRTTSALESDVASQHPIFSPQGSEDMLVPDSEDEADGSDVGDRPKPAPLNLQQFSFSAG
ncbi:putative exonuclease [Aspergillus melleus]|nr:Rad2 nuclease [Aspergillus melleus]KAH8426846.1 Rad2 nuclease [Aspergillus melleus]